MVMKSIAIIKYVSKSLFNSSVHLPIGYLFIFLCSSDALFKALLNIPLHDMAVTQAYELLAYVRLALVRQKPVEGLRIVVLTATLAFLQLFPLLRLHFLLQEMVF